MMWDARTARSFFRAACILGSLVVAQPPVRAEDFLIVERPGKLLIFNRYQQQLKSDESEALLPFIPFRILSEHDVLGDGFTPCMKVEANGAPFYLLKDDNGGLTGVREAGTVRTIRNASVLRDSVEIVAARGVVLWDPTERTKRTLPRGSIVARQFSFNGMTYVQGVPSKHYGWVRLDASTEQQHWRLLMRRASRPSEDLARVLPAIVQRVEEVNGKLRLLFDHLNTKTSRHLSVPSWRVQRSDDSISCILETSLPVNHFGESSFLLGKRIESTVLGTSLRVYVAPGAIQVR